MLIGEEEIRQLLNELDHLRRQRQELLVANNREIERRRAAVREAGIAWEHAAELQKDIGRLKKQLTVGGNHNGETQKKLQDDCPEGSP
jgi:hypothetical protein